MSAPAPPRHFLELDDLSVGELYRVLVGLCAHRLWSRGAICRNQFRIFSSDAVQTVLAKWNIVIEADSGYTACSADVRPLCRLRCFGLILI